MDGSINKELVRKRVLVTGGAGFLGSHLCNRLLADGHNVLCVDNLYTSTKDNILDLLDNHNFEFMRHDVTFPLYVEVDEIYNLACPASPIQYQTDPVQTTKTSVHGAINMLGLAKRVKTPSSARRKRTTGATSILLVCALATMKANAAPRPCVSIISGSTDCRSRLQEFLIPTAQTCCRMTAGLCPISS